MNIRIPPDAYSDPVAYFAARGENWAKDPDFPKQTTTYCQRIAANQPDPRRAYGLIGIFMRNVYRAWLDLKQLPPGERRAELWHARVDRAVSVASQKDAVSMKTVQCRKGCSACCHIEVDVTEDEARLLAEKVRTGQAIVNREKMQTQVLHAGREAWRKLGFWERTCAFLDTKGECQVYADRPVSCRAHFVSSDPALCADLQSQTTTFHVPDAEVQLAAGFNLGRVDRLPKLVLEMLEGKP